MSDSIRFSRRGILRTAGLLGVASVLPGKSTYAAPAAPGSISTTNAGTYHFTIGDVTGIVLSDGWLESSPVQPTFASETSAGNVEKALSEAFLATDRVRLELNTVVFRHGADTVLVDGGGGSLMGPSAGYLVARLKAAGIEPGDITHVVITHAHPDHVGGLLTDAGRPVFARARTVASADEVIFWTSKSPDLSTLRQDDQTKQFIISTAVKYLDALAPSRISSEEEILPWLKAVPAAGHTPGHIALEINSGGEKLLHIADIAHHFILNLVNPKWTSAFDAAPRLAVHTRKRIVGKAASERTRILGYHLPFPGLGHFRKQSGGFAWVAEPWIQ